MLWQSKLSLNTLGQILTYCREITSWLTPSSILFVDSLFFLLCLIDSVLNDTVLCARDLGDTEIYTIISFSKVLSSAVTSEEKVLVDKL